MATIIYYFGIIFSLFVALQQAEAVTCYRCVYMQVQGADQVESETKTEDETSPQAQTAEVHAITYGNAECKEDGDKFRIDYVTQDECVGDLELVPVAAYKSLDGVVSWNSVVQDGANTEDFLCQKSKFTLTSSEPNTKAMDVWYRGCAYKMEDDCVSAEDLPEADVFKNTYADIFQIKVETVSIEGDACSCKSDTCNGGISLQISQLLVAFCGCLYFTVMWK